MWKKENKALHSLHKRITNFKEVEAKLNRYHEMKLDQTVIHIPKAYGYSQLTVVLTWNKFKVLTPHGEILMNEYRPYMNKKIDPMGDIMKQWSNKLNVVSYSRYWKYLPARLQNYLAIDNNHLKYRRIKQLLSLLATYDIQQINEQFYELVVQEDAPLTLM